MELAGESLGAPHYGPFDAIIVTAATPKLPPSLTSQLAMGGRMVIPIGSLDNQELIQARRTEEGSSIRWLESCRFVPLIGRDAFLGILGMEVQQAEKRPPESNSRGPRIARRRGEY